MRETSENITELDFETESVADKRIIITGGTTGIGRATTLFLAARGAHVFTFGRHQPELEDAMRDFREVSDQVYGTLADTSRLEDIRRVFDEADQKLGALDIFINNAA